MSDRRENISAYVVTAGILFPLIAALVVVFGPWAYDRESKERITAISGETIHARDFTDSEGRGAWIYLREGCQSCHTRASRPIGGDPDNYGPVNQPGEYARGPFEMIGARRVGQDLSRIGGKYDNDWHIAHFLDPKAVVPGSIMPRYPWLFVDIKYDPKTGRAVEGTPTVDLLDLISYLQSLGVEIGEWRSATAEAKIEPPQKIDEAELAAKGKELYGNSACVTCHGPTGMGDGPASGGYPPESKPANFTSGVWKFGSDDESVKKSIRDGQLPFMPPHPQFSEEELTQLSAFVRSLAPKK